MSPGRPAASRAPGRRGADLASRCRAPYASRLPALLAPAAGPGPLARKEPSMRLYETIFITLPDLTEEQDEGVATAVKGVITGQGGEIVKEEDWGVRTLAYEVKHNAKGHYHLLQFRGDNQALAELDRHYRFTEPIIKFMTLRLDEK
ncbi:MAG: 30S ribosomal protein S6 [Nitrospirae bacterium]|nr:MAG: 30S ribosomal protein S6 [Nitrospirota bacterium]